MGAAAPTAGVDLAAAPTNTAVAVVDWSMDGEAELTQLTVGVADDAIVEVIGRVARAGGRTGIDCPLGWPERFVEFLLAHRGGTAPTDLGTPDARRPLLYRRTDLAVIAAGHRPLSVAADRIAHPAVRVAGILARLSEPGRPVDRSGRGPVAEVYPAVALRHWGLTSRAYKGTANAAVRSALVGNLLATIPWLRVSGGQRELLCRSDHALDALVSALVARAVVIGAATVPPPADAAVAAIEGWIALPTTALHRLPTGGATA
ncbi:DUF429 domain-containing protein [Nakamurella flava]|uniref:DUF429 domain-containing protein n=1 Tax=Nakamurella flava TaxID=2576308 RepID=A0A4U6QFP5_9ACTN|nr:DUF429 domain-containing protein [Nakamurella flava]